MQGLMVVEHRIRTRSREFLRKHCFSTNTDTGVENAKRLEKHIFNWTVRTAREDRLPLNWDYVVFRNRYIQRVMSIKFNLLHPKNPKLFERLKKGEITMKWLVSATPYDMFPELWEPIMEQVAMKQLRKEKTVDVEKMAPGAFQCGKCRSRKTSYYQLQLRSADEPMTTFVTCHNCNNRFKC